MSPDLKECQDSGDFSMKDGKYIEKVTDFKLDCWTLWYSPELDNLLAVKHANGSMNPYLLLLDSAYGPGVCYVLCDSYEYIGCL